MKHKLLLLALSLSIVSAVFSQEATGDPWIKEVYNSTWGRNPTALEYNIYNYNNGSWNNKAELMKYIYEFQKNLNSNNIKIMQSAKAYNGNYVVALVQNNQQIAVNLISPNGGTIVASGGGNIISTSGGNLISPNGASIVASGGGNIVLNKDQAGFNYGNQYVTADASTKVVKTSTKGAWVIRK